MRPHPAAPLLLLSLAAALVCTSACQDPPHALLLTLTAERPIDVFDLRVRAIDGGVVLEQLDVAMAPADRDISAPGQGMRIAIEFTTAGDYLLHVVGRRGTVRQIALRRLRVERTVTDELHLVLLTADADADGFPACGSVDDCDAQSKTFSCAYLDCRDDRPDANPFAREVCGNETDDDCSAGCGAAPDAGDVPCLDGDGDGSLGSQDCDDDDPCRAFALAEAANLCATKAELFTLPQACLDALARDGKTAKAPNCGDGIDQDCDGADTACVEDSDCDGLPATEDCNDNDPTVNRAAAEICGDQRDNNCDGNVDEGCVPCDVDGDLHAAIDASGGDCTLPKDDPDDYDAGVSPDTTADEPGGVEGGTVRTALRGFCRSTPNKDGKAEREVDHDGDGMPASADGCPQTSCDADGDGFPGPSCAPPKLLEDCNDSDPTIFPGAPDRCGDGIAQNCLADASCTDDGDGDGYQGADDCNAADGSVHPWAIEICNALDDDCDGLIDEGNPDNSGALISPALRCNDSNVGTCGELTGSCGCSKVVPNGNRVPGNRTACPGEAQVIGGAAQRCLGAIQPQAERCGPGDFDCDGRDDDPQGANLADSGLPCGTDTSRCVAGVVVGCDLGQTLPNAATLSAVLGSGFNPHWICSRETVLPLPEQCNGQDDDCDGALGPNEKSTGGGCCDLDGDGDGYSECTGDCNDADNNVHPNQSSFATSPSNGSFDYNCDGVETPRDTATEDCYRSGGSCDGHGWDKTVPGCGQKADWIDCEKDGPDCLGWRSKRTQACH